MQINYCILSFFAGLLIAFFIFGNKTMRGIIDQTLKNPRNGEWSRKNLCGFLSFAFAIFYCCYGMIHDKEVQEFVVLSFLGLSAACLGISSWEKLNIIKTPGTTTTSEVKITEQKVETGEATEATEAN